MSVTGISSTLYTAYRKVEEQKTDTAEKKDSAALGGTSAEKQESSILSSLTSRTASLDSVSEVMERLGYSGRMTRTAISQQKERLEKAFEAQVKSDLKAMGVAEDIDFRVAVDQSGAIVVNTEHEDKAKVEAYFRDHPQYAQVLKDIEVLSNAQKQTENTASTYNPAATRKALQSQYIGSLFLNSGNGYATNILNFANGAMQSILGISKIV